MRWNKGGPFNYTLKVPGEIGIKATVVVHSESIVITIIIGGETVRKWGMPASEGAGKAMDEVERLLNGLAQGIWEG